MLEAPMSASRTNFPQFLVPDHARGAQFPVVLYCYPTVN